MTVWKTLILLVIMLSVGLNLAFVGAWAVRAAAQPTADERVWTDEVRPSLPEDRSSDPEVREPVMRRGHPPGRGHGRGQGRGRGRHGGIWCPLHRRLDTTPEQWRQLEPELMEFQETSQAICEEVNRKRREMIDLIAAPKPDRRAIAAKQEEILAAQRKMQNLVIDHFLATKQILNTAQQEELFDLLRQRGGCRGRGPGMGPGGQGI